jgi:transposase
VINPSDIPSTEKEKKQKRDTSDCCKMSRSLSKGELSGIYIFEEPLLEDRLLVRTRQKLLSDIKRIKNRMKSILLFTGRSIPQAYDSSYWSKGFRNWLRELKLSTDSGTFVLLSLLNELESVEEQKKKIDKQIVILANTKYIEEVMLLKSIPGIGILGAITLLTEIGDINRFSNNEQLHSFVGLIPNVYASGDKEIIGKITARHNHYLRPIVIQCTWWYRLLLFFL